MNQANSHIKGSKAKNTNKPKAPRKISPKYLRNSGLHYLKRFTTSSSHFKTVMRRKIEKSCKWHNDVDKNQCLEWLDEVTEEFIQMGYINDELYSYGIVNSMRRSGKSRRVIEMKLVQKGVEQQLIKKAFEKYESQYDDHANFELISAIKHAKKKKLGIFTKDKISLNNRKLLNERESEMKEKQKQLANFARAGFSFDIAKKVLEMDEDEALDLIGSLD